MDLSTRTLVGIVLLLAGSALLFPAIGVTATGLPALALIPATLLLAVGTYLIGTDVQGAPA